MQMAVIIDLLLAAVLLLCVILGWRRGAFRSVIGIIVVAAALVGAGFVAQQGAPIAANAVAPFVTQQIENRFEQASQNVFPVDDSAVDETDAEEMFSAAGLYHKTAEKLAKATFEQVRETGQAVIEAAADSMIRTAAGAILFLISFIILLVVLKIVSKILGLLTAVPGLHLIDCVGGAFCGLVQGCLILFVFVWATQFIGSGIPEELAEKSVMLRFFAALNPMELIFSV